MAGHHHFLPDFGALLTRSAYVMSTNCEGCNGVICLCRACAMSELDKARQYESVQLKLIQEINDERAKLQQVRVQSAFENMSRQYFQKPSKALNDVELAALIAKVHAAKKNKENELIRASTSTAFSAANPNGD